MPAHYGETPSRLLVPSIVRFDSGSSRSQFTPRPTKRTSTYKKYWSNRPKNPGYKTNSTRHWSNIYEESSASDVHRLHRQGYPVSNAFIVLQDYKRRIMGNLVRQSTLLKDQPVCMETSEAFAFEIKKHDRLFSFNIAKGYHHLRIHPDIRNLFLFRLDGRYFRCVVLLFGWKLSPAKLIKFM